MLVHLVDGTQDDVKTAYKTIRSELALYDEALAEKPEIVVLNKIDALDAGRDQGEAQGPEARLEGRGADRVSGVTGQGVRDVLFRILAILDADKADDRRGRDARAAPEPSTGSPLMTDAARALSAAHGQDRLGAARRRQDRQAAHRLAESLCRRHRGAARRTAARSSSSRRAPSRSAAASSGSTR